MILPAALRRPLPFLCLAMALALSGAPGAAQERRPIPGAGDWQLSHRLPGVEQRTCTARITGPDANITLVLNNAGVPLLMLGRSDWNHNGGEFGISVAIDGGAAVRLRGSAVATLVLVLIPEAGLQQRLRTARMLDWTFPFGRFRTNVAGFGAALDAVRACGSAPA